MTKPGDQVLIPWGLDEDVHGLVLSLFGPPGKQFARVEIDLGLDGVEVVSLPVDVLKPAA